MRHRVKKKTLKRDGDHRKALLRNLSASLVLNESLVTTVTKAKYLRPYIEKLITSAKKGNDFNTIKQMHKFIYQEQAVRKIIDELGPRFKNRNGGYTRIIKLGNRKGDSAPLAMIEFVEKPVKKSKKQTKTTVKKTEKKEKKVETKNKNSSSKKKD